MQFASNCWQLCYAGFQKESTFHTKKLGKKVKCVSLCVYCTYVLFDFHSVLTTLKNGQDFLDKSKIEILRKEEKTGLRIRVDKIPDQLLYLYLSIYFRKYYIVITKIYTSSLILEEFSICF